MQVSDARPLLRLAEDLTTLTRSIHDAAATRRADLEPLPPAGHLGAVMELRTALLAGAVPLDGARAIFRYHPQTESTWSALEASGWLTVGERSIQPRAPTIGLCQRILRVHDEVTTKAWGTPARVLEHATAAVAVADEVGPAFRTWRAAGWAGASTAAGRLFLVLTSMRYLRADAHAAAWQVAGHTAASVAALAPSSATRHAIEADTDERHAAALSRVPAESLAALITAVAGLVAPGPT